MHDKLVSDAVRKNTFTAKCTDGEIDPHVKRWFQLSGDRDGGRKDRETLKLGRLSATSLSTSAASTPSMMNSGDRDGGRKERETQKLGRLSVTSVPTIRGR